MTESEMVSLTVKVHFLLNRGWEYNEYTDEWKKTGMSRMVDDFGNCRCGGCHRKKEVDTFDTLSAYETECEYVSSTVDHVMST